MSSAILGGFALILIIAVPVTLAASLLFKYSGRAKLGIIKPIDVEELSEEDLGDDDADAQDFLDLLFLEQEKK